MVELDHEDPVHLEWNCLGADMISILLIAVELITLHMIDGRVVQINPKQITQMLSAVPEGSNRILANEVNCVIRFTDGSFLSVLEDCDTVRKLMNEDLR